MLQYKAIDNILYANKVVFKFGKRILLRCSFCKLPDEAIIHLFYDCLIVKRIWNQVKSILSNNLNNLCILGLRHEWTHFQHFKPLFLKCTFRMQGQQVTWI